ncbi:hypothetical protein BDK51DRAFT_47315 [Blyttiomyces helicus]|uniref:FHA domain-containing protein n=1 Tax=Blyttiomyces helicus TaxID=388810 RepID=A0A4P9W2S9_9FUNG|nr:hypothetical protein BDK51DRAFT_47315 [Blyttiomyces helicus]|eukprot:RKO86062.1 hypothetical protein BDK51DRAFT_47315 [Blyttiomyces helicus]
MLSLRLIPSPGLPAPLYPPPAEVVLLPKDGQNFSEHHILLGRAPANGLVLPPNTATVRLQTAASTPSGERRHQKTRKSLAKFADMFGDPSPPRSPVSPTLSLSAHDATITHANGITSIRVEKPVNPLTVIDVILQHNTSVRLAPGDEVVLGDPVFRYRFEMAPIFHGNVDGAAQDAGSEMEFDGGVGAGIAGGHVAGAADEKSADDESVLAVSDGAGASATAGLKRSASSAERQADQSASKWLRTSVSESAVGSSSAPPPGTDLVPNDDGAGNASPPMEDVIVIDHKILSIPARVAPEGGDRVAQTSGSESGGGSSSAPPQRTDLVPLVRLASIEVVDDNHGADGDHNGLIIVSMTLSQRPKRRLAGAHASESSSVPRASAPTTFASSSGDASILSLSIFAGGEGITRKSSHFEPRMFSPAGLMLRHEEKRYGASSLEMFFSGLPIQSLTRSSFPFQLKSCPCCRNIILSNPLPLISMASIADAAAKVNLPEDEHEQRKERLEESRAKERAARNGPPPPIPSSADHDSESDSDSAYSDDSDHADNAAYGRNPPTAQIQAQPPQGNVAVQRRLIIRFNPSTFIVRRPAPQSTTSAATARISPLISSGTRTESRSEIRGRRLGIRGRMLGIRGRRSRSDEEDHTDSHDDTDSDEDIDSNSDEDCDEDGDNSSDDDSDSDGDSHESDHAVDERDRSAAQMLAQPPQGNVTVQRGSQGRGTPTRSNPLANVEDSSSSQVTHPDAQLIDPRIQISTAYVSTPSPSILSLQIHAHPTNDPLLFLPPRRWGTPMCTTCTLEIDHGSVYFIAAAHRSLERHQIPCYRPHLPAHLQRCPNEIDGWTQLPADWREFALYQLLA